MRRTTHRTKGASKGKVKLYRELQAEAETLRDSIARLKKQELLCAKVDKEIQEIQKQLNHALRNLQDVPQETFERLAELHRTKASILAAARNIYNKHAGMVRLAPSQMRRS